MIEIISSTSGLLYRNLVKKLLFLLTPDNAHGLVVKLGGLVGNTKLLRSFTKRCWSYENDVLSQELFGISFPNPIGLSAGLDKNGELVSLLEAIGFGFVTTGSVTAHTCAGNPRPWFYRLPKSRSLVIHAGLANQGVERVAGRISAYKLAHMPLIVSIAKTNTPDTCEDAVAAKDYCISLEKLQKLNNVAAIEINISCPNTYGGEPFTTAKRLDLLLNEIEKTGVNKPSWIKMPINLPWLEFRTLLDVAIKHNVQAVTIGNLNKDRQHVELRDELPSSVKGNLSGYPTRKLSNELIAKTYLYCGDRVKVIGVGGVDSAESAYEKICLGASLVGLITGMIFEGPQLIGRINHQITEMLKADGFSNISEAVGSAHRK